MASITVNGHIVPVDESFLNLTPEEQDRIVDELSRALPKPADDVGSMIHTAAGGLFEGVPIAGPIIREGLNQIPAAIAAGLTGQYYDDVLKRLHETDAAEKKANPGIDKAAQITGGVVGTVPAILAAPELFGAGGGSMLARSLISGLTGGGIGAADAHVRSGGDSEKTRWGAIEGGLLGLGGPLAGEIIGAGVKATAQGGKALTRALLGEEVASKPARDILADLTRDSRKWLAKVSDPDMLAAARDRFDKFGSETMFADILPEWRGVAKSGAAQESTRSKVVGPLNERGSMAGARLKSDFETNFGPDPVPSTIEGELKAGQERVKSQYRPMVEERPPFDSTPIAEHLDKLIPYRRGGEQSDLLNIRNMLNDFGKDTVSSDPAIAYETRRAIDRILKTADDPEVLETLRGVRGMLDERLARSASGVKELDAQFAELGRQREGLLQGQSVLVDGPRAMRPAELQEKLVTGAEPQGTLIGPSAESARMRQGTLGDIYRAVGTEASDMNALRKIVRGKGDWNREKLGMMFGPEKADASLNAIDREALFADTANGVTSAADTARQAGFEKYLGEVSKAPEIPTDKSWTDLGLTTARRLARSLLEGNAGAHAARVADEVAPLSVLRGDQRDALMEALVRLGPENIIDQQRMALINALVQGGGGRAVYPLLPGEEHK
ncbi:hypothetical protein ACC718_29110 [Rhizobium ruizarguesonis]|uniref:hypothetical protein n=1 Tax=Rhizobium ruizarguesonis TaxID=2081791 RepID=UPI00040680B6|nr:hypothetical protein [Rhizobium ruizarguesonis]UFW95361.1 hypothetical protein RlegTA1_04605 [Rhizobium ruizarguesonis]